MRLGWGIIVTRLLTKLINELTASKYPCTHTSEITNTRSNSQEQGNKGNSWGKVQIFRRILKGGIGLYGKPVKDANFG